MPAQLLRLTRLFICSTLVPLVIASSALASTQTTALTYQGVLKSGGSAMNASVDLQFKLFDAAIAGNQVGSTLISAPVLIVNGLFSVSLDFGALAFNGEERWLEIAVASPAASGVGPFTTLTPRQKLASAPYAAFALNAQLPTTYGSAVSFNNAGNSFVGNGAGLTSLNPTNLAAGTAGISITGNAATASTSGNVTGVVAVVNGGTGATSAVTALASLNAQQRIAGAAPVGSYIRSINVDGTVVTGVDANSGGDITDVTAGAGLSGGASSGNATLSVVYGGDGASAAAARADHTHDANEITIGNLPVSVLPTGGAWSLASTLNIDSNTFTINPTNNSVGIGVANSTLVPLFVARHNPIVLNPSPSYITEGTLVVGPSSLSEGTLRFDNNSIQATSEVIVGSGPQPDQLFINEFGGNVGIGTAGHSIDAVLHIESDDARVVKVDRWGSDGELLAWARDDGAVGSITVTGGVVAYGAFTGVHYAQVDDDVPVGALVSLTGDNTMLGGRADGEVVYGAATTARANDPAVLGVYIGSLHGADYNHPRDLAQVAALGNGDLWIVDSGSTIEPGDYLIASDVPGCAMKDDPQRYAVGNIIARAASRMDWSEVATGSNGRRRARISVLFESFVRDSRGAAQPNTQPHTQSHADSAALIEQLQRRNEELEQRLAALEQACASMIAQQRK